MTLVLILFIVSFVCELSAVSSLLARNSLRRAVAAVAAICTIAATALLLSIDISWVTAAVSVVSIYRIFHEARIYKGRMHPAYLRRVSIRSTSILAGVQAELWLLSVLWQTIRADANSILLSILLIQLSIAILLYISVRRHKQHVNPAKSSQSLTTQQLPSITVAIAARDETDELMTCLQAVVASDYPKLEVLVLDDCSQNRRTSEIIRGFAQKGVRFIPGGEPPAFWLARNHAYNILAAAASGSYVLFISTSILLDSRSIRSMADYLQVYDKQMLSVLPMYKPTDYKTASLESMRSAWELLLPRRWIGRPPISSSCWMVRRDALQKIGGFAAVSRMIIPEVFFAQKFAAEGAYSYLPGGSRFGIISRREYADQTRTAVRTYYPMLHKQPENVLFFTTAILLLCILPFVGICVFALRGAWLECIISLLAVAFTLTAFRNVLILMYGQARSADIALFPVNLVWQLALLHYSMYKYEFSEVIWKDRNVCIPVMHVVPHLPKLGDL